MTGLAGGVAGALALGLAAVALGAPHGGAHAGKVPAKHSFSGHITAATGHFKGDVGSVSITVGVPASNAATRPLTLRLRGHACGHAKQCVKLDGKVKGTLSMASGHLADVGQSFDIKADGTVKPVGHASATGSIQGTGFILHGHEGMQLTLTTAAGTLTLAASSAQVPGFTSP